MRSPRSTASSARSPEASDCSLRIRCLHRSPSPLEQTTFRYTQRYRPGVTAGCEVPREHWTLCVGSRRAKTSELQLGEDSADRPRAEPHTTRGTRRQPHPAVSVEATSAWFVRRQVLSTAQTRSDEPTRGPCRQPPNRHSRAHRLQATRSQTSRPCARTRHRYGRQSRRRRRRLCSGVRSRHRAALELTAPPACAQDLRRTRRYRGRPYRGHALRRHPHATRAHVEHRNVDTPVITLNRSARERNRICRGARLHNGADPDVIW